MKIEKGAFLVIEGTDGSGKSEQWKRLVERLCREGHEVATVDFPRYKEPSSYFVREYLNGRYGGLHDVGPKQASLFYALDRFAAGEEIRQWLAQKKIVVANRYLASNMAHQGAKIDDVASRKDFFRWVYDTEYDILNIPKPDLNIILHVPAEIAYELVAKKETREYLDGKKRDIHEANLPYLKRAENVYLEIARLFPEEFIVIECAEGDTILSREEIESRIWEVVCRS